MIGHLGLNVPDLAAARAYYDSLLPRLGFEVFVGDDTQHSYRPAGGKPGTFLFLYPSEDAEAPYARERTGLQHLAFMARTRTQVREVHDLVRSLGSKILHPPRDFPQYAPTYYATFWLDPHGFMLEAVCHHDRD